MKASQVSFFEAVAQLFNNYLTAWIHLDILWVCEAKYKYEAEAHIFIVCFDILNRV
jgi:hypothetical protein